MTDKAGAAAAGTAAAGTAAAGTAAAGTASAEDDELSVPRASVNKMIRELAPNMRISNETRELIINCCNEFIHLIASESNEVCNTQSKKTIAPEHVLVALENLGFKTYLADVKECVDEAKEVALKKRRQSTKLENLGIPEEELLRQQQELFAKAREEQAAREQQEWVAMQQQVNMTASAAAAYNPQHIAVTVPAAYQPVAAAALPATYPATTITSALPVAPQASIPTGLVPSTVEDDDDDY